MYYHRNQPYGGERLFFGGPLLGGFVGGLLGGGLINAFARPRPFYPYPPSPFPPGPYPYYRPPYVYGTPYY